MKLYKLGPQAILQIGTECFQWTVDDWDLLINRDGLHQYLKELSYELPVTGVMNWQEQLLDPPMDHQEIWAAGVTYSRSKDARMQESQSGGAIFYDLVYDADRPEIFYKANRQRTVGHGDIVYIRRDSNWDVPEPELTLFVNSRGSIQAYCIGNDMSSRSIEGENPLYLPQAKVYERCAALGPCLYIPEQPINHHTEIHMKIERKGGAMYEDQVKISRMKRSHYELVEYLFKECEFPNGVFLMTGTCLVPGDDFTLQVDDRITISIDHIGSLINTVGQAGNHL